MSSNKTITRIAATQNAAEPLFGSVAGGCRASNDKVWLWGDDNMLPYVLSLMARRSVIHRRIINDKAESSFTRLSAYTRRTGISMQ